MIQSAESQQHHAPQVVTDGGLLGGLLETSKVLFPSDDILLHAFLRFSPDISAVEGSEEELVDLHWRLSCYALFESLNQQLHSPFSGFSFSSRSSEL